VSSLAVEDFPLQDLRSNSGEFLKLKDDGFIPERPRSPKRASCFFSSGRMGHFFVQILLVY